MTYKTLMDSLDKVAKYLHAVADEPFTFKGVSYDVSVLHVSPTVFRDYKCPAHCGACCRPFTMDWIPSDSRPNNPNIVERKVEFNGTEYSFYSDQQLDRQGELACRYLRLDDGRCSIHDTHTLSCDFPMITVRQKQGQYYITGQLFGRLGQMRRPTGGTGGMCTIDQEPTQEAREDVIRKFRRLQGWCNYLGLSNRIDKIVRWAEGPTWSYDGITCNLNGTVDLFAEEEKLPIPVSS